MDGPLWFGTHNKTSEHTAAPESTELTQEFPITLAGKRIKISEEKGNVIFHCLGFFWKKVQWSWEGKSVVYSTRTQAMHFPRSWIPSKINSRMAFLLQALCVQTFESNRITF